MSHVLLDTHAWAWTLSGDKRLSQRALEAIEAAETVSVSAISLYEIGQKVRLGKWPEMASHHVVLIDIAEQQGVRLLPISPVASIVASNLEWPHRDPFDRIIAATAIVEKVTLISVDAVFDDFHELDLWPGRLW